MRPLFSVLSPPAARLSLAMIFSHFSFSSAAKIDSACQRNVHSNRHGSMDLQERNVTHFFGQCTALSAKSSETQGCASSSPTI